MPVTQSSYSGCIQWIDPAIGVTLSSGRVSAIADQSGAGNDLAQATAGVRPVGNTTTPASAQFDMLGSRRLTADALAIDKRNSSIFAVLDFQTLENGNYQEVVGVGGVYPLILNIDGKALSVIVSGNNSVTFRITSSICVLGVVFSASGVRVHFNGQYEDLAVESAGTLTGLRVGSPDYPWAGNLYRLAVYDNAKTADGAAIVAGLMADFGVVATPVAVVVRDGDSITAGGVSTANDDFKRRAGLPPNVWVHCVAKSGQAIANAAAAAAAQVDALYQPGIPFIYAALIGTNSIFGGGVSGADAYTAYKALLQGRKTANAATLCAAYTILPRAGAEQAERTAFNVAMRADFPTPHATLPYVYLPDAGITYADIMIDFGAVTGLSFSDGTHPDDDDHIILGAVDGPAIASLFDTPDTTPPTVGGWTVAANGTTVTGTLSESGCLPASYTGITGFGLYFTGVQRGTVLSMAIAGTDVTLENSLPARHGEGVEVRYAPDDANVRDAAGNIMLSFTDEEVTNNSLVGLSASTRPARQSRNRTLTRR